MKTLKRIEMDLDFLKKCKKFSLELENLEKFHLAIDDILEIQCVAEHCGIRGKEYINDYLTQSGYIKLSSRVKDRLSTFTTEKLLDEKGNLYPAIEKMTEEEIEENKLVNRLNLYMDVCAFSILAPDDTWMHIYLPYDPVCDAFYDIEFEYSSCPSFETDENGDFLIKFGELSNRPIVKRNNYHELIDGWRDVFGDFAPTCLVFDIERMDYREEYKNLVLTVIIKNKEAKKMAVDLIFEGCRDTAFDIFPYRGFFGKEAELYMTRLLDGSIYASISSLFETKCKSCKVSEE